MCACSVRPDSSSASAVSSCTVSAASECASTSWISRAIRARSSSAADRACSSRALWACAASSSALPPDEAEQHRRRRTRPARPPARSGSGRGRAARCRRRSTSRPRTRSIAGSVHRTIAFATGNAANAIAAEVGMRKLRTTPMAAVSQSVAAHRRGRRATGRSRESRARTYGHDVRIAAADPGARPCRVAAS